MADDTKQGDWQATTEDSHAPDEPGVGAWRECEATDPTYLELASYSAFRNALCKYIDATWFGNVTGPRLPEDVQQVLCDMEENKDAYPTAR